MIIIENFSVVQKNENGIAEILKSETEEYYTINYSLELMKAYGNFTFNNKQGNISFTLFDDGTTVLDNIPYVINKGLSLITRSYYENTVLPLIK